MAMTLRKQMFEVEEAANGVEALEAVYQQVPELILLDLMMPEMDGRQFLMRMQDSDETKEIPVIVLTAADSEDNEAELLNLGAQDFVSKAASSPVLISRIRRLLRSV